MQGTYIKQQRVKERKEQKKSVEFYKILFSFESLQGSEVPALVFFGNQLDGKHNNEIFSRCISNLILVIKYEVVKSLLLDPSQSQVIPIYGLCFLLLI
jgi:hypothetical protein